MSEHYPRIRIRERTGALIREGLSLDFYMHPHVDTMPGVVRALDTYLGAVQPRALDSFLDLEGEWQPLDDIRWVDIRRDLLQGWGLNTTLTGTPRAEHQYRFDYQGKRSDIPTVAHYPGAMSALSFWLPTEYIEEHGPDRVRDLALELAAHLPLLCSGYVGLCIQAPLQLMGVMREIGKFCFRYPGMDISEAGSLSWTLGTRVRGPSWLTFLGQPLLEQLGGVAPLRARLKAEGTIVQAIAPDRALITLGPWPEAGDTERGDVLPAYRELARILEPWLHEKRSLKPDFPPSEDRRRWERRFLD